MITIIHGDDIVSSRNFLNEQKTKTQSPKSFTDGYILTDLVQALEGSLFENETTLFIENLLSKKKSKEKEDIISYLSTQTLPGNVYIWEEAEIPQKTLTVFKKADSRLFKLPKLLFTFVDTIAPHTNKELVVFFHRLLEQSDAEFIFAMIVRQFRLLLGITEEETIDEVKRLAPWQKSKLTKQRSFFTDGELIENYSKLGMIDTKLKTGTLSLSLIQAIDFFLLDL